MIDSSMRNVNEIGFDYSFASPLGSEEPKLRSVSGRSIPRLVKVRKHVGSNRGRSRSILENRFVSDFNPFGQVSEGSVRVDDDSRFQELNDRYNSQNSSSGSSISGDFEIGKSDDVGFVFGANLSNSRNLNSEGSGFDGRMGTSLPDELKNLNVGSGKDAIGSGGERSSLKNLGGNSKKSVFVFKSSSKNNSDSDGNAEANKLPDEMGKLNIESSGNIDVGEKMTKEDGLNSKANNTNFVFGRSDSAASAFDRNLDPKLPDKLKNLNIEDTENVGHVEKAKNNNLKSKVNNVNTFVFGSSGSVASALDRSADSKLPDEMKNLNIDHDTGNVGGVKKTNDAHLKSTSDGTKNFMFGNIRNDVGSLGASSESVPLSEMKKLNIEESRVGDNLEKTNDDHFKVDSKNDFPFGSSKSDTGSFIRSTINMLPDEMKKLNMGSKIRNPGDFADKPSSSSFNTQLKNTSDKMFNDPIVGKPIPGSFSFEAEKSNGSTRAGLDHTVQPNDGSKLSETSTSSYSFPSSGLNFQSSGNKAEFSFGTRFETPHTDFRTPKQDASCSSTGNPITGLNQKLEFSAKKGAVKDTKSRKRRGKVKHPAPVHQSAGQHSISRENSFQEKPESPGCYSPMDVSPYPETLAADKSSRDTSVTSDEYFHLDTNFPSADPHSSVSVDATDEDLITATESMDINKDDLKSEELNEGLPDHFEKDVCVKCPSDEFVSGVETKTKKVDIRSDASVAATESDSGFHSHIESKENDDRMQFCFASSSEDVSGTNFKFAASPSAPGHISTAKRHYKKKSHSKVGQDLYNCTLNAKLQFASPGTHLFPFPDSSQSVTGQNRKGDSSISQSRGEDRAEADEEPGVKQGSISKEAAITAAHEACEKWRFRGNQAYAHGNLSKAEEYYTRGLKCVPGNETSIDCLTALMLCYSNRAAARMSSGRIREALGDCTKATEINPDFLKVQVRAANCHLVLGEIEDALKYFKNCLPSGADLRLDRKIVIEASNGLQRAQKVAEYLDQCTELLQHRTSNGAESALQIITDALSISPHSEKLIEFKAEALLVLRKYDEAIQLCEQSLDSAEKNSPSSSADEILKNSPARLWRWYLIAKSYFHLGRLEEALNFLEKLELAEFAAEKFGSKTLESSSTLAVTVRELLRHKAAGNEAFQSGRHSEAVEHYTSALSCNVESRPFAAICFGNRAAAHQALGQITDAIADCSLAIALDGNYPKAISRRATLHEMIRDYGQAVIDLRRLTSLLEKQTEEKASQSGRLSRSSSGIIDLRQAHSRLSTMEEEAKKGIPLDLYLILGIESSGVALDIKKAYRKAALRHHPDKACQFLPRSENGDDWVWKEIAEEVHKDADRLFKMIGEAYAVLSDPVKRSQYDEDEVRNTKKGNGCSTSRTPSDTHNYPFERTGSRRQWTEARRSYRNQYSPWSESSRYSRYT